MMPAYRNLFESGELDNRIERARALLGCCTLCPRQCKVDRLSGRLGICKTAVHALVSDVSPHFGEEQPLVGANGSGTIFFAHCNLLCLFCQNYDLSHRGAGTPVDDRQLADCMLALQEQGCHNINFVTPTHVVPQILAALKIAAQDGLTLPLIYNCSGYESIETLKLLDGIIDIYMPDFKFWSPASAERYARAPDYPEVARKAIKEMHRQVGALVLNKKGLAERGLLVRHLLMPEGLDETEAILDFIAADISKDTYINIMDQYHPCGSAVHFPPLDRPLSRREYHHALDTAHRIGLTRLDKREVADLLQRIVAARKRQRG